jgi:L-aspartate oxidase
MQPATTKLASPQAKELRRYLVNIDSPGAHQLFTHCLVIGSGIAGLRAALEAAREHPVILVCKGTLDQSNTWDAQGGIASVLNKEDSFAAHIDDTLRTGCGLCDPAVVEQVVMQGPALLKQLVGWGTQFDRIDQEIDTTLEGGHSHARVAHAHGDSTGRIIAQALIDQIRNHDNIRVLEHFFAIDLLTSEAGECVGILGFGANHGYEIIWSASTLLATGGAGQLYRETTNPQVATGDGLAMAYRAGAVLQDLELMQFHPTTLYIAGASRALITETLRGEGAILVDRNGDAFMKQYDPAAELAPRDVVSRAILAQMHKTESTHVFLDVRHFDKTHFAKRFPLISELCESFDINIKQDLIPVRPSAHYMIGGIKTDSHARTSIPRLFACGEVASSGLHGANRLGSNSLLEGLVFGSVAGRNNCQAAETPPPRIQCDIPISDRSRLDAADVRNALRALMWRNVGITRREHHLSEAMEIITFWQRYVMDKVFDSPEGWECQNMLTVAMLVAHSARERQESRGVHFRSDFPHMDNDRFACHLEIAR